MHIPLTDTKSTIDWVEEKMESNKDGIVSHPQKFQANTQVTQYTPVWTNNEREGKASRL